MVSWGARVVVSSGHLPVALRCVSVHLSRLLPEGETLSDLSSVAMPSVVPTAHLLGISGGGVRGDVRDLVLCPLCLWGPSWVPQRRQQESFHRPRSEC